jgi:hypothetical protein
MSLKSKPTDLGKYSKEELETMDFRELECIEEAWTRPLGFGAEYTDREIYACRMATYIYLKRRNAMRQAAPELLGWTEILFAAVHTGQITLASNALVLKLSQDIKKAKGV